MVRVRGNDRVDESQIERYFYAKRRRPLGAAGTRLTFRADADGRFWRVVGTETGCSVTAATDLPARL